MSTHKKDSSKSAVEIAAEYKAKLAQTTEKANQAIASNHKQSKQKINNPLKDIPEVLDWCVDSILEQMQISPSYMSLSDTEKDIFKLKLTWRLISTALEAAVEQQVSVYPDLQEALTRSNSLEELVWKIGVYSETFPEFAYQFVLQVLTSYMLLCTHYKMTPALELVVLYRLLLEQ